MLHRLIVYALIAAALLTGCAKTLTAEEKAQVQALRSELDATKKEVATAEVANAQYAGGLLKAFVTLRLEVLKTNQALLEQRINAIESGAKMTLVTAASKADPDRAKQLEADVLKQEIKATEAEAKANVQGGLIGAMASMSAATERNTLAMMRQQYFIAKYGIALPALPNGPPKEVTASNAPNAPPNQASADSDLRDKIIEVSLLRKRYGELDYQNYIWFDVQFTAKGLDKPARAIKGALQLTDLFGEQQFSLGWTIDKPIKPEESQTEKGSGFKYNQFLDKHQWVRATSLENMKARFRVDEILYEDGTSRKFD